MTIASARLRARVFFHCERRVRHDGVRRNAGRGRLGQRFAFVFIRAIPGHRFGRRCGPPAKRRPWNRTRARQNETRAPFGFRQGYGEATARTDGGEPSTPTTMCRKFPMPKGCHGQGNIVRTALPARSQEATAGFGLPLGRAACNQRSVILRISASRTGCLREVIVMPAAMHASRSSANALAVIATIGT